ncbi:MAG: methyl-accepting chemotaxis protein, partial [Alphaproteobacteria bacterium]|nr:methyl-accepting chemotaxis protein [Alphaproteobacteria bacterium]
MAGLKLNISNRILLIVGVAVLGMAAVGGVGLNRLHDSLLQDRMDKSRNLAETAYGVIAGFDAQAKAGVLSVEEAQKRALAVLDPLRYGNGDYFWVNDMKPVMIQHPNKKLNGQDLTAFKDPTGKALFVEMVQVVRTSGEGFVPYMWPKPGFDQPVAKISYVKGYKDWGWVIGTGIYLDDVDAIFRAQSILLAQLVFGAMVVVVGLSLMVSRSIVRPVRVITNVMGHLAKGKLDVEVPTDGRTDEIGEMVRAVQVFKDNALAMERLRISQEQERLESERRVAAATRAAEQEIGDEVAGLAGAFSAGEISRRMTTEGKDGVMLAMSQAINHLAETIEAVVGDLGQALEALAQGDLEQHITADFQGAYGKLKNDFNTTSERLATIVKEIGLATEGLSTAASEVSAGNTDLSERTEQQAASLEETAASMEQLGATVRTSADTAKRADRMAA